MSVAVRIGELNQRVTVQRATQTTDSLSGDEMLSWATLVTIWAAVEPLSSAEFNQPSNQERGGGVQVRFRFRYSTAAAGITDRDRIVWRSQNYDIARPYDLEGAGAMLETIGTLRA